MPVATNTYALMDAGNGRKLEQFGPCLVDRPCAQAVWRPSLPQTRWQQADAFFTREQGAKWEFRKPLPENWICDIGGIRFRILPTDFGHLGVFPEHALGWKKISEICSRLDTKKAAVLNLFAYSGGATLALAKVGCEVCHLDASKKMVDWARQNADLNELSAAPIRWIVDDVQKFLKREIRRGKQYDGIVLDPPSFGRGSNQELFQIDHHMLDLLELCCQVLSATPKFLFLSCHTPGYTPLVLQHLLKQTLPGGAIEAGELLLPARPEALDVPSGTYACWQK
ncbi:MAG: class I SAM-dependent methyltransferase [Lentisphaeria bacterium]